LAFPTKKKQDSIRLSRTKGTSTDILHLLCN